MTTETMEWFDLAAPPTRHFSIYLPSRQKDGREIENFEDMAAITLELLCDLFGGATSYPALGMFQGADASPQKEEIRMIECFCNTEAWDEHSRFLHILIGVVAKLLNQEVVGCALDGRIAFVPPVSSPLPQTLPGDAPGLKRLTQRLLETRNEPQRA